MDDAAFFLADGDARVNRIPTLYGAVLEEGGLSARIAEEQECYPTGVDYRTNQTAHYAGPRSYESGDTGSIMTARDYSKFYDMLLAGGISKNGERLLSKQGVVTLCKGRFKDLTLDTALARAFGVAGKHSPFPKSFNFGWATAHGDDCSLRGYTTSDHSDMSNWGRLRTHPRLFLSYRKFLHAGLPSNYANNSWSICFWPNLDPRYIYVGLSQCVELINRKRSYEQRPTLGGIPDESEWFH